MDEVRRGAGSGAEAGEAAVHAAAKRLRAIRGPDVTAAVMHRVLRRERSRWRLALPTWAPTPLAAAAALCAGFLLGRTGNAPAPSVPASDPAPVVAYVQFRLDVAEADRVRLVGTFTDWRPEIELVESRPGVWTALVPVRPGVHDYLFVVNDERWVSDPAAHEVPDGWGGTNSRIIVPRGGSART